MGFSYDFDADRGTVKIQGFNCEDDVKANVRILALIRRVNQLRKDDAAGELSNDEEIELDALQEYIDVDFE